MKRLMLAAVLSFFAGALRAELNGAIAESLAAQPLGQRMLGEWRKLPDCRPADGGRQNVTSTMRISADNTAEAVILSYRQSDTTCAGGRIGRTVATYTYSIGGPSDVAPGAFHTTWTVKSVKVYANNGDVWDRTNEFGGTVSRNIVKIVEQSGVSAYYTGDADSGWRLQSKPSYVRINP